MLVRVLTRGAPFVAVVGRDPPLLTREPGAAAAARGLTATLHPHVGTIVESGEETERVLDGSSIGLCLDTGHLLIGGGDPVAVAKSHPDRIAHVHLKDVRLDWARRVQAARGPVKVGSFPADDTHLMVLSMASGQRLKLVVIPSDTTGTEGARLLEFA